ncbi:MAG: major facilitator superfamily 1 [Anaerosporomusa subterranea]|jgi:DHA1 family multidrug resistance protein-like MFS transporter|nr:major facilitator superfamily 1 [Anaerosporomusa subterranea]
MIWQRNLGVLCIGVALSGSSYTMVIPFLPLYLLELGVNQNNVTVWSGIIFSSTFLVAAVLAPYWGRKADQMGKKRMLIRAGICLAVVYFLGSLARTPYELLGMRILQGVANGFVPASFAIVSSSVPEHKMGTSLGFMQTGLLCGGILGPLLGGTLSHLYGMRQSFVIAALIIFLATVAAWLLVEEPKSSAIAKTGSIKEDIKAALSNRALVKLLFLLLLVQMTTMVLQPLITLYIAELQGKLDGAELLSGFIFGLTGVAGALAAPFWGKLGQKRGFYIILITTLAGAGVINSLQFFVGNIVQFSLVQFVFGLFIAGVIPAINAMVVANTDSDFRGRAFGLTTSANQLGSMLGPIFGGIISSLSGIKAVFVFTGIVLVGSAVSVWRSKETKNESC